MSRNPYIGPRPFKESDSLYGRDRELKKLRDLLIAERIVLLHSPSGAGKTSLIRAALMPALREEEFRMFPVIRVGLPPEQPNPATGNRYLLSTLLSLEEEVDAGERLPLEELSRMNLAAYLERRKTPEAEKNGEVLIFDQFEEVLTVDPVDLAAKTEFFAQLGAALRCRYRWCLFAMREEYVASLAPFTQSIPARLAATFRLDFLGQKSASQAMQRPAELAGVRFHPAAARKLIDDLRRVRVQQPDGSLIESEGPHIEPVQLQVVCYRLWQNLPEQTTEIQEAHLHNAGDVDKALVEYYAEQVRDAADKSGTPERTIREWIDRHLITEQGIRGQALRGATQSQGVPNHAIALLVDAHLIRAEQRRGATWYELAHDRLIAPMKADNAEWFRMRLSVLQRQAEFWKHQGQPDDLLLRGQTLEEAERWAADHQNALTPVEQEFLASSRKERRFAQQEQRMHRIIVIIMGVIALALAATLFAFYKERQANAESQSRELAAAAAANLKNDPELSILLSLAALDHAPTTEAVNSFNQAMLTSRVELTLSAHAKGVSSVSFDPDGGRLATVGQGGLAKIWDAHTGRELRSLDLGVDAWAVRFTPDGQRLLTANGDGSVVLWEIESARRLLTIPVGKLAYSLDLSRDGALLIIGGLSEKSEGIALICDARTGAVLQEFTDHEAMVRDVKFSPDGTLAAIGSQDQTVTLRQVSSGRLLATIPVEDPVYRLAFDPKGEWLAIANAQSNNAVEIVGTHIWNVSDPAHPRKYRTLPGHSDSVTGVLFSPDGQRLATASIDRTVLLWDIKTGEQIMTLSGHRAGGILEIAINSTGTRIATAGWDGTARIWDIRPAPPGVTVLSEHHGRVGKLAFSADGRLLASGSDDGTAIIRKTGTWERVGIITADGAVSDIALSQDGRYLAVASGQTLPLLWDVAAHAPANLLEQVPEGAEQPIVCVAFSPDGQWLAGAAANGEIAVWDMLTGAPAHLFPGQMQRVTRLAFSPDGKEIAIAGKYGDNRTDWRIDVWDIASGKTRMLAKQEDEKAPTYAIDDLAYSPDGQWLTAASGGDAPLVWERASGLARYELFGHVERVFGISIGAASRLIATASADNTVKIWRLPDAKEQSRWVKEMLTVPQPDVAYAVAFTPDETAVAVGGANGDIRLYMVADDQLKTLARQRITRTFSQGECQRYLHLNACPPP